jgi:hypothetical protein
MATEVNVESLTCPICLDKIATYILSECSHSLCYICIESLHNHSQNIKCPTCRKVVTKAPILFQSLAYTMPENTHTRMKSLFDNWFNQPISTIQSSFIPYSVILQESAKKEFEDYHFPNITIETWQNILNRIRNNNAENVQFDNISSIQRISLINSTSRTHSIHGEPWKFIPFTQPIIFKDTFRLIEKSENNNLSSRHHRRLIVVLTNSQLNLIRNMANIIIRKITASNILYNEINSLYNEINTREGYLNTICIHSGVCENISALENTIIGCRGIWLNRVKYGFRFHILNG